MAQILRFPNGEEVHPNWGYALRVVPTPNGSEPAIVPIKVERIDGKSVLAEGLEYELNVNFFFVKERALDMVEYTYKDTINRLQAQLDKFIEQRRKAN